MLQRSTDFWQNSYQNGTHLMSDFLERAMVVTVIDAQSFHYFKSAFVYMRVRSAS